MTKIKEPKENINRRSDEFKKRMRAKGFVRVFGWVPEQYKEKVLEFIRELRGN
jgi:hypothetical protein